MRLLVLLEGKDVVRLLVDLVGFYLVDKHVTDVRLEQRKGNFADSHFFVLQRK